MYAAAGGASLASRQARQRQKQNKQKTQRLHQVKAQNVPEFKNIAAKHFHNYTDSPEPPKVPLSKVDRGSLKPPSQNERRHSHSTSHYHPGRAKIRESPSISIPVQNHQPPNLPLTPTTLVQQHPPLVSSPSIQSQLPQIFIPPESEGKPERRCSFVRQVEEVEKRTAGDILDRCNHICNFEIKEKLWDNQHTTFYSEYDRDIFGSLEYPFSECSQGRAAWQERERGRRCSLSEEARQHRIKQTEAHHRWMKRNRIHDSTFGGGSDEEDFFSVYHQSAAANALLYVGLGTTAIGSVIFFVGTGEKGFKTLELRMIGPTLIACGLLCCLIRVLLCACPSTCFRKSSKTRLKNTCPHSSSRYPLAPKMKRDHPDYIQIQQNALPVRHKKQVSIVPPNHSLPSTSTSEFKEFPKILSPKSEEAVKKKAIPEIQLPPDYTETADGAQISKQDSLLEWHQRQNLNQRCDSIIELENLELTYEVESVSSNDSESATIVETEVKQSTTKLNRKREPINSMTGDSKETSLSVVIERSDNSESSEDRKETTLKIEDTERQPAHSGIVLSPLQLGQ
ncbi:uncharacterized protein LOC123317449 isoform X1 [Coccinella septempunctata]|uniref:uncharacterized protein LOC123317449 isoform X1 n=1 Tax=Coccinella septempunctata TaxID=41139 RepID=UPI001D08B18E|nr:uncharacterized protein LOC123317449 isoform X1 [Coccinella septempunctata]XP_044759928.1 uncharacterized protein LOC123317449 isoform X1 [Coccinella septempunctata]XP_044759929.1 uncharacterized protein LOC123317449 isoform X1 [Coccinella septempunctata]XP_044759930.1 uncharacterized protein LOC123317449 isoform X1 [Coccinella septempunctata]XP_044759931.1 uncharacterized protein LOC123317449 isoform X1 [Coccinella septempunctata]